MHMRRWKLNITIITIMDKSYFLLFLMCILNQQIDADCLIFRLYMQPCVVVGNSGLLFLHLNSIVYNDADKALYATHFCHLFFFSFFPQNCIYLFAVFCASGVGQASPCVGRCVKRSKGNMIMALNKNICFTEKAMKYSRNESI